LKPPAVIERGDFQTPLDLCTEICDLIARSGVPRPNLVLEPCCGTGSFVLAAACAFPDARIIGVDIDGDHLATALGRVREAGLETRVRLVEADLFEADWRATLGPVRGRVLVVGNPPWVTSDRMRRIGGRNLPARANFKGLGGLDAITGKGNFDVSEWVLLDLLDRLQGVPATVAMLCKTAVARRVVERAAATEACFSCRGTWAIDARARFGAAVAACVFVFDSDSAGSDADCRVFTSLDARAPDHVFGSRDGVLVADMDAYERWRGLAAEDRLRWRSGIKHDCARVFELVKASDGWRNGLGEIVDVEDELLHPLIKGTDLARDRVGEPERALVVTQRHPGDDTSDIAGRAPRTWAYLDRHRALLAARRSSIYRGRPEFAIFGVGPYSFAPWKVAVSGLHADPAFRVVGQREGRPFVLDDTCMSLAFEREGEARAVRALLESHPARELLRSLTFRDAKRPVTRAVLERIHLGRLAALALDGTVDIGTGSVTSDDLEAVIALADVSGARAAPTPVPRARPRSRRPGAGR
jgi:hypothetical protein